MIFRGRIVSIRPCFLVLKLNIVFNHKLCCSSHHCRKTLLAPNVAMGSVLVAGRRGGLHGGDGILRRPGDPICTFHLASVRYRGYGLSLHRRAAVRGLKAGITYSREERECLFFSASCDPGEKPKESAETSSDIFTTKHEGRKERKTYSIRITFNELDLQLCF